MEDNDNVEGFAVVINDEEQYSIWPVGRGLPEGWQASDFTGTKPECLTDSHR